MEAAPKCVNDMSQRPERKCQFYVGLIIFALLLLQLSLQLLDPAAVEQAQLTVLLGLRLLAVNLCLI